MTPAAVEVFGSASLDGLASGARRVNGAGRGVFGLTAAPSHATQAISGAGSAIDLERRRGLCRPAVGQNLGGVANQIRRAETRCADRLFDRRDLGADQRTAVALTA